MVNDSLTILATSSYIGGMIVIDLQSSNDSSNFLFKNILIHASFHDDGMVHSTYDLFISYSKASFSMFEISNFNSNESRGFLFI